MRDGLVLLRDFKVNVAMNSLLGMQFRELLRGDICAAAKRAGVTSGKVS
jgi:hypothetical protein